MNDVKNKASNLAGLIGLLSGLILTLTSAGILPKEYEKYGAAGGGISAMVIGYLTGKKPDGTPWG